MSNLLIDIIEPNDYDLFNLILSDKNTTPIMKNPINQNIAVSFSGGRTSAMMSFLIKKHWDATNNVLFLFANTGKETEETLEFVNKCDIEFGLNLVWLEVLVNEEIGVGSSYKIVDFESASRNGEPFEKVISKYGIPNVAAPHCSKNLKGYPLDKYKRDFFGKKDFYSAIGIRVDEFDRMSSENNKLIYPLIQQWPTNKQMVMDFWKKMPFDLDLPKCLGNCDLCVKKGYTTLSRAIQTRPNIANWWIDMEEKYGNNFDELSKKQKGRFFRNNMSATELKMHSLNTLTIDFFGESFCEDLNCTD